MLGLALLAPCALAQSSSHTQTAVGGQSNETAKPLAPLAPTDEAKAWTQEIPGSLAKLEMVKVKGGTLETTDAQGKPVKVEVKPFSIGRTEVTWDVFDIYALQLDMTPEEQAAGVDAKARPSKPYGAPDRGWGHAGFAAIAMTGNSAKYFCEWLSKKTGKKYRLSTEAEWEWAARAGKNGEVKPNIDEAAWYWENAEDRAHAVASKAPNAWGMYDTLGNVWEWTHNADGSMAVRGGGFMSKTPDVGVQARAVETPKWSEIDPQNPKSRWWLSNGEFIGLRVVCED
jgi:formylglycine-generating enzyme required for sulfatase activity